MSRFQSHSHPAPTSSTVQIISLMIGILGFMSGALYFTHSQMKSYVDIIADHQNKMIATYQEMNNNSFSRINDKMDGVIDILTERKIKRSHL